MQIKEIINELERFAPLAYQESYDNAGLIVGNPSEEVNSALICLDITEAVIDEAIQNKHKLVISHHPLIFKGLKKITGKNEVERCVIKAIQNNIAIYASHTNMDSVMAGVNGKICDRIGLTNRTILSPIEQQLMKLVAFVPKSHFSAVQQAVFAAGAGAIGNYDSCGFAVAGEGAFRAGADAQPFVGELGKLHTEQELRFETIMPKHKERAVVEALKASHPYEEVAYDLYALGNANQTVGIGMLGDLQQPMSEQDFLKMLKGSFGCSVVRHTNLLSKEIKRVAVCGGSGSFLINQAMMNQADVFVTADLKYHDFFAAEGKILLTDIGHFESEQYTQELFSEILSEKFPNFVVQLTAMDTNAVKYFI